MNPIDQQNPIESESQTQPTYPAQPDYQAQPNYANAAPAGPAPKKGGVSVLVSVIVALISVIAVGALSVCLGLQINRTHAALKQADTYKASLMETEDGKKKIEEDNQKLNDKNQQLDQEAADANQQAVDANQKASDASKQASDANAKAADAQAKLNDANKQLQDKLAEVQQASDQLTSKQADLEKAQRGIAKFSDLETLFNAYNDDAGTFISLVNQAYTAALNQNRTAYDDAMNQMNSLADRLDTEYAQITQLFIDIRYDKY